MHWEVPLETAVLGETPFLSLCSGLVYSLPYAVCVTICKTPMFDKISVWWEASFDQCLLSWPGQGWGQQLGQQGRSREVPGWVHGYPHRGSDRQDLGWGTKYTHLLSLCRGSSQFCLAKTFSSSLISVYSYTVSELLLGTCHQSLRKVRRRGCRAGWCIGERKMRSCKSLLGFPNQPPTYRRQVKHISHFWRNQNFIRYKHQCGKFKLLFCSLDLRKEFCISKDNVYVKIHWTLKKGPWFHSVQCFPCADSLHLLFA